MKGKHRNTLFYKQAEEIAGFAASKILQNR